MTKINFYFLFASLVLFLFYSCKTHDSNNKSNEQLYELRWQVFENNYLGNYRLAEKKFDSLLTFKPEFDRSLFIDGLEAKHNLGKLDDVSNLLGSLDLNKKNKLCQVDFLKKNSNCSCCNQQKYENELLHLELINMYVNDQAVRGNLLIDLINEYNIDSTSIVRTNAVRVDSTNISRLKEIIEIYGFPNESLVGTGGMKAVFIFIQHADRFPDWQKAQLDHIKNAVIMNELKAERYAYLFDRIRVNSGEKQLYGTQFKKVDIVNGIAEIKDTEDMDGLYRRRMEIGMMPLDVYKRFMLSVASNY
jgi:hypothetical protein